MIQISYFLNGLVGILYLFLTIRISESSYQDIRRYLLTWQHSTEQYINESVSEERSSEDLPPWRTGGDHWDTLILLG